MGVDLSVFGLVGRFPFLSGRGLRKKEKKDCATRENNFSKSDPLRYAVKTDEKFRQKVDSHPQKIFLKKIKMMKFKT